MITPIVHSLGIIPVSRIILKRFTITVISSFGQFLMNSLRIKSMPGVLLFLRDVICFSISSVVNALLIVSLVLWGWLSASLSLLLLG